MCRADSEAAIQRSAGGGHRSGRLGDLLHERARRARRSRRPRPASMARARPRPPARPRARPRGRRRPARRAPSGSRMTAARARCRSTSSAACSRSIPDSTNTAVELLSTSSASARSEAVRCAAAAGLLSSWASPAAIVPSDASRSRFCSRWVIACITGRIRDITRWNTGSMATTRSVNGSGATTRVADAVGGAQRQPGVQVAGQRLDRAHPGRADLVRQRLVALAVAHRAVAASPRTRGSSRATPRPRG